MKKLFFLLSFISITFSSCKAQDVFICDLPSTSTTASGDLIIKNKANCADINGTESITVANFVSSYSIVTTQTFSVNVTATLYVTKGGVDATGLRGRLDKPFLTIAAAQTAASSGDVIIVYPGTYSEGTLGKSGVRYHFIDGAILSSGTSPAFTNAGSISFTVSGDAEIITTSGTPLFITSTGTVSITAKKITSTSGTTFRTGNSASLYANIRETCISSAGDNCILLGSSFMFVKCPVLSAGGFAVAENQSTTSTLYINCQTMTSSGSQLFNLLGTNYIYGNMVYTGSGTGIAPGSSGLSNVYIYGNLNVTNSSTAYTFACNNVGITGTFDFYGSITGGGPIYIANCAATYRFTLHGDIDIVKNLQGAIIQQTGILILQGRVKNLDSNVGSFGIDLSTFSGTCIIQNAVIVTGSGSANSIYSGGNPVNVVSLGSSMANKAKDAAVTIVAGTLTINANVQ